MARKGIHFIEGRTNPIKIVFIVFLIVGLFVSVHKFYNETYAARLHKNVSEATTSRTTPANQENKIGIGVYGDWTVKKVGSMSNIDRNDRKKNEENVRDFREMCDLKRKYLLDTVDDEKVIFHKAATIVDEKFKSGKTSSKIDAFWHMGAFKKEAEIFQRIVSRQHELLRSSGLWEAAYGIHIGIVGDAELPPRLLLDIDMSPHVNIFARISRGDESVTTTYMRELCRLRHYFNNQQKQYGGSDINHHNGMVVYFHSRGVSHPINDITHLWTNAMEYYIIKKWKNAAAIILSGADTAGMAKCVENCRLHYSGNFFWATVDYITTLPDPNLRVSGMPHPPNQPAHKYSSGEMWLLTQDPYPGKHVHFKLHNPIAGLQLCFDHYVDAYYFKYYSCMDSHEPNMPSRVPCEKVQLKRKPRGPPRISNGTRPPRGPPRGPPTNPPPSTNYPPVLVSTRKPRGPPRGPPRNPPPSTSSDPSLVSRRKPRGPPRNLPPDALIER